jgi:hypothetical protein
MTLLVHRRQNDTGQLGVLVVEKTVSPIIRSGIPGDGETREPTIFPTIALSHGTHEVAVIN